MGWMKPVIFALGLMFWSLFVILSMVLVRISISASLKARLPHCAGTLEEAAQTKRAGSVTWLLRGWRCFQNKVNTLQQTAGSLYPLFSSVVCSVLMLVTCPFPPAHPVLIQFLFVPCVFNILAQKAPLKNLWMCSYDWVSSLSLHLCAWSMERLIATNMPCCT